MNRPQRGGRLAISPDWVLAAVLIVGLVIMLAAVGGGSTADGTAGGPRLAVGMTPTDGAIRVRIDPCGVQEVEAVSLTTVEPEFTLWEAIAIESHDRKVFVVGQAPTTFVETVPLIAAFPRGALLDMTITAGEAHSTQFYMADLLPDLWFYEGTHYPGDAIGPAIAAGSSCPGVVTSTSGHRALMIVGFLIATAAGAWLLSRRLVSPGL